MLERMREAGFHNVKVDFKASEVKGAGVDLVFTIAEGRQVTLTQVEFRGNKAVPKKSLLALLAEGGSTVGSRYWRGALERGLFEMSSLYYDTGYVNVSIGQVEEKLSPDGASMSITIPITEGDQFRLGGVSFKGALVAPEKTYAARFGLRRGQVFSRRKVSEGLEKVRALQLEKGPPGGDVIPVTEVDTKKKRINLTLQLVQQGAAPAAGAAPAPAPGAAAPAPGAAAPAPAPAPGAAAPAPAPAPAAPPATPAPKPAAPAPK
jgi:outer membrane protein insertion porin family